MLAVSSVTHMHVVTKDIQRHRVWWIADRVSDHTELMYCHIVAALRSLPVDDLDSFLTGIA